MAYKLWINDDGRVESAVYRPESKSAEVEAFLSEVRVTIASLSGSHAPEPAADVLRAPDAWDVVDVILQDDGGGEGCSIGTGRWGRGRPLTMSELLMLVLEDVDERLRPQ